MPTINTSEATTLRALRSIKYDVIVVGGGLAGLVVANRLSEDPSKRILVVEAGKDRRGDPKIDTPGLLMSLWGDEDYDYNFYSEPQTELSGRQLPQPRGKVLGGSSAINVTALAYPSRRNFESWTKLGNQGWTHEDLAPYYQRFHTFHPGSKETTELLSLNSYMDVAAQGTSGPLAATFSDAYGPFNNAWMTGFQEAGFAGTSDPIKGKTIGPFTPPNSIDPNDNKRSYSASAYYNEKIEKRSNLDVLTETSVRRVLLSGTDGSVIGQGVEVVMKDGTVGSIRSSEVVLSAGALQTPQVLERSGIGSRSILEQHGIPVVVDLDGVGENLQDHCFSSVSFQVNDGQTTMDAARDPKVVQALLQQYHETQEGPLSGIPFSLAYLPAVDLNGQVDQETLKELLQSVSKAGRKNLPNSAAQQDELRSLLLDSNESDVFYGLLLGQMNVNKRGQTSMQEAYTPKQAKDYITIMVGLNHPWSRGSVHIRDKDARSAPTIDPKYLGHEMDIEVLGRGMQFLDKLVQQPAFQSLLKPDQRLPPGAELGDLESAKQLARDRLWSTYHPSCTCAMMSRDKGGVVNDKLVVHGTQNVRVIDASVFPMMTLGNIQSTVYALAEKGSDLVRRDWSRSWPYGGGCLAPVGAKLRKGEIKVAQGQIPVAPVTA